MRLRQTNPHSKASPRFSLLMQGRNWEWPGNKAKITRQMHRQKTMQTDEKTDGKTNRRLNSPLSGEFYIKV